MRTRRPRPAPVPQSAFAGFRFPPDVIVVAVRWYLRFGLSYRDVEELLTERGVEVDHVTIYRWVQRFMPSLADAARPCRHLVGDRWQVDETYVKVAGQWRYVYRAIDQFGQVIDVFVLPRRDAKAAHRFFERAIGATKVMPVEITTDQAPVYPAVLEELLPVAWHRTDQYGNNRVECDHGRLKARLRPIRGLKQDRNAAVIIAGHAFVQNGRRGYYELAAEEPANRRWRRRSASRPWPSDHCGTRGVSAPRRRPPRSRGVLGDQILGRRRLSVLDQLPTSARPTAMSGTCRHCGASTWGYTACPACGDVQCRDCGRCGCGAPALATRVCSACHLEKRKGQFRSQPRQPAATANDHRARLTY
jgi:transposase-like protein